MFCSFVFLFSTIWMAFDHRQARALGHVLVLIIVGIVLGCCVCFNNSYARRVKQSKEIRKKTRCFGPTIVREGHLWDGHWVLWVGPAIACMAFALYTKIIPRQHFHTYA
ncbi:hypothetical protein Patl1_23788 [Pistacia atlantica]|uniref:Uncharacterized protein n=1 Tax=Pistacia atlantica TaxID=434234 RepID=A0ACC1A2G1_9ROSI|nr:hypothetical protein Patl1_23788 [Pistacia atlantica]